MNQKFQKAIDFLLGNANPSIKLRVKKEILGSITAEEEATLKSQILQEKIICFMAEKQQENGWIGLGFHGSNKNAGQYDNQETATKYMGEKGLKNTSILESVITVCLQSCATRTCSRLNEIAVGAKSVKQLGVIVQQLLANAHRAVPVWAGKAAVDAYFSQAFAVFFSEIYA